MSVVVAIKKDGKIYMGCDSQATCGGTRTTLKNPNNYKIWKVIGAQNCLMASVGAVRDACVVRTMYDLVPEIVIYKDKVNFDFVVNSLVPHIATRLRQACFMQPSDSHMESSFLFAYENKLYNIGADGAVIEIEDYVSIGSGKNEAIGSLVSTQDEEPIPRIIKAIKASASNDIYVDYPIIITDTNSTEFSVITEKNESEYTGNAGAEAKPVKRTKKKKE